MLITAAVSSAISFFVATLFIFFLMHERRTGMRHGKNFRLHFDFYVLKVSHAAQHFFRYVSSDLLRQVMHYTFHTALGFILAILKRYERRLSEVQRANRMRARSSRMERTTRNKLDEIAEHKIAVALTEEEKRHRKEKHLLGG